MTTATWNSDPSTHTPHQEGRPLEIGPAPPPRPTQWRRALRLLGQLTANPRRTETVFELMEAIGGQGSEATFQRFLADSRSRALLREAPDLVALLSDRARLARLPEGSFGRAYLDFAERNQVSADGLLQARDNTNLVDLDNDIGPARRWFYDRLNPMHDLWHVLTGYDPDISGEMALLGFSVGQGFADRALKGLFATSILRSSFANRFERHRFLFAAWRRGRRARALLGQPYEVLLGQPLEEVRSALGVRPFAEVHPRGLPLIELPAPAEGAA